MGDVANAATTGGRQSVVGAAAADTGASVRTTGAGASLGASGSGAAATAGSSRLSGRGLMAAAASFVIWGCFPLYLKPLNHIDSLQVVSHRVAWACVLLLIWLGVRGELRDLGKLFTNRAMLSRLLLSAVLITANWLGYVWGVAHGRVLEASLGYFINPLANVLLGVLILRERLNAAQWTSVAVAAAAVIYVGVATGTPPWIALTVATSFSLYGLVRKVIQVEALQGLAVETLVLAPLALGYLVWCELNGTGVFGHSGAVENALLLGCGPITAVPLFLFAYGARLIPYSTVGLLLYITPSLQMLSGIFLYHESFSGARAIGFAMIWVALLIYVIDGVRRSRQAASAA
jgi:chloramphenicol-sensitive protein RarD